MQLSTAYKERLSKAARIMTAGAMVVSSVGTAVATPVGAASLAGNKTTIQDSRLSAVTTYTTAFSVPAASQSTPIQRVDVKFCQQAGAWGDTCTDPAGFGLDSGLDTSDITIANFGNNGSTIATTTRDSATSYHLTLNLGTSTAEPSTEHTIELDTVVTSPSGAGTYYSRVRTYSGTDTANPIDSGESAFAVLDATTISGRVLESLTFTVASVGAGVSCGTYAASTVASTVSTVPFGNFNSGTPRSGCQKVATATNANGGYTTTIKEVKGGTAPQGGMCRQTAANCLAEGGDTGVASADVIGDTGLSGTAVQWTTGGSIFGLGYGVSGTQKDGFSNDNYFKSLFGATPLSVSKSTGPTTAASSEVYVIFKADVTATQVAGNYQNAVEYVTTPSF